MSTPVKHHTRGKVGRRRSHLAIKPTQILACDTCKAPILPHRVCGTCGTMHTRSLRIERGTAKQPTGTPKAQQAPAAEPAEEPINEPATDEPATDEPATEEAPAEEPAADETAPDKQA